MLSQIITVGFEIDGYILFFFSLRISRCELIITEKPVLIPCDNGLCICQELEKHSENFW